MDTLYQPGYEKGKVVLPDENTFKPDILIFVKLYELTLKLIWVDAVIFKLDDVEPIKLFTLFIFVFNVLNEDKILFPATDRDVKTDILSDVILLELKSFAPLEDKIKDDV